MADHSTQKFNMEENNLRYSAFSKFSEKPIEAEIRQVHPDTPVEDFFQQPGELTLHLFLVTSTGNIIQQEIFKLNSHNHIIIE
jgi:hypothetical protein